MVLQQAGIDVLAGIDIDPKCQETYEANIKGAKYILADIKKMEKEDLSQQVDIKRNDGGLIFVGCSPCQYWTIIRTDKKRSRRSKNLLSDFYRFVDYYNPGYVVVENVPGILNRKRESGLDTFIQSLEDKGYTVYYAIVNMYHYGIPETRKRFSLVANRVTAEVVFPRERKMRRTVADCIGEGNGFKKIAAGTRDPTRFLHTVAGLSKENLRRLKMTRKDGGSRDAWSNTDLQIDAYKRKGGSVSFSDTYGRMSWDKPAPTITTKFFSISNGRFAHPEEIVRFL